MSRILALRTGTLTLQALAMGRFGLSHGGAASKPASGRLTEPAPWCQLASGSRLPRSTPPLPVRKKPASRSHLAASAPAAAPTFYKVDAPQKLKDRLDSWGPKLLSQVLSACSAWSVERRGVGVSRSALQGRARVRVGTDCSGAEAPIWALRAMNHPHTHTFSCDWKPDVRAYIASVCAPEGPIFDNMLTRKDEDIPEMDVYVCGFPCTPFSMLRRHKSRLLQEDAAKPFMKLLQVLRARRPALAVLENVLGIEKVMKPVCNMLRKLGCYFIIVVKIDSKELGVPLSRPRYYFILVRQNAAIVQDIDALASLGKTIMTACKRPVEGTVMDLMLSQGKLGGRDVKDAPARPLGSRSVRVSPKNAKAEARWIQKHAATRKKLGLGPPTSWRASDALDLQNPRMRDAWQLLADAHPGKSIIADLSQNVDRGGVSTNGVCPTLTPNSVMYVMAAKRRIQPLETLAMHFFPVHRMKIPTTLTGTTLRHLGGNTMHLKSVALALCMGLAMMRPPGEDASQKMGVETLGSFSKLAFLDSTASSQGSSSSSSRKRKQRVLRGRLWGSRQS